MKMNKKEIPKKIKVRVLNVLMKLLPKVKRDAKKVPMEPRIELMEVNLTLAQRYSNTSS